MSGYRIPEAVNMFKVYNDVNQMVGVTGQVKLPSFEYLTNTISTAGMAGEYDAPVIGHIGSQTIEIPFGQIDEQEYFKLVRSEKDVVLRAIIQTRLVDSSENKMVPMSVVIRGATKSFDLGTVEKAKAMGASIVKEVTYIKVIINNTVCLELDKFNSIFVIDGVDMYEKLRSQI